MTVGSRRSKREALEPAPRVELVQQHFARPPDRGARSFYLLIGANVGALGVGAVFNGQALLVLTALFTIVIANSTAALFMIRGRRERAAASERVDVIGLELNERCHFDRIPGSLRRLTLGGASLVVAPQTAPPLGAAGRVFFTLDGLEFSIVGTVVAGEHRGGSQHLEVAFPIDDLEVARAITPLFTARQRSASQGGHAPGGKARRAA